MYFITIKKALNTNIRVKLKVALFVVSIACSVAAFFIYSFFYKYGHYMQEATVAHDIAEGVFTQRLLIDEFILDGSSRAQSQLVTKQDDLEELLNTSQPIFHDAQGEYLFSIIYRNVVANSEVFDRLLLARGIEPVSLLSDRATPQKESRLSSELLVNAQESISAALSLHTLHNEKAAKSFKRIIVLFSVSSLFLLVISIIVFLVILRNFNELDKHKTEDESILSGIGDGVVAIDRNWNIILWNKAASTISGWSSEEALGKPLREILKFIRERDRSENLTFIEHAIVLGKPKYITENTALIRKDGSEIPVGDSAAPIMRDGVTVGAVIVFRDVSQEREAAHLRSDFAYASHQLRTPVTEALWNLETAMNQEDPTKRDEELRIAHTALESVQKLAEHLVAVSEIDQGSLVANPLQVKLLDMCTELGTAIAALAEKRKVKVVMSPVSPMVAVSVDKSLLKKALREIIENAVLYSREGAEVTVLCNPEETELVVEVTDRGVGITAEEQPIIFTKFFRGSNRGKNNPGAGLGLYIARAYIKLLGGKIWFTSEEGKGTTFYLSVPLS